MPGVKFSQLPSRQFLVKSSRFGHYSPKDVTPTTRWGVFTKYSPRREVDQITAEMCVLYSLFSTETFDLTNEAQRMNGE